MAEQILAVILMQTILFGFYYTFGLKIAALIGRRVCPQCFAIGSTWLILLIVKYVGIAPVNKFLVALLLAESAVGFSSLTEEFIIVRQAKISEPLLKFGLIIYGTLAVSVFALVHELIGLVLFAPVVLFGFLALTPVPKAMGPKDQGSLELETKLKNCC